jgi:PAS domain S-box-containing protein
MKLGVASWLRENLSTAFNILFAISVLFVVPVLPAQPEPHSPKKVLILYSFDSEEGIYGGLDNVLRSQLRLRARDRVEVYTEYLDLVRFPAAAHADDMVRLLRLKYADKKPDLIVPVSYSAIEFLLGAGKDLFSGVPLVALFNARRLQDVKLQSGTGASGPEITGVASTDEPSRTVDLALRLQPDTRQIAVIVGSSPLEQYWLAQLKQDFSSYAGKVEFNYLTGMSIDQLLKRVADLPPQTVIVSTFFFQDATGQFFHSEEVLDLLAREAHVPIYAIYSSYIGHGVLGGRMTNSSIPGKKLADLAVAVLNGEKVRNIPIIVDDSAQDMVDWRQLQRWRISEKLLPPSTVVAFREPSALERYRVLIIAVLSLCVVETLLILALIANVQRRRRADQGLIREKTLADAVIESLPGIFVMQDETGKNVRWNKNAEAMARFPFEEVSHLGNVAGPHKGAAELARREVFERGATQIELEMLTADGGTKPFYFNGVKVELEGKPYLTAVGIDLTEIKKAEEAVLRSEAELRALVEHAPYGIGTISIRQDRFLHANPALVKLLGYKSEAEVQAITISRDLHVGGDLSGFRAQPTRAEFFSSVEFVWQRKDRKAVHVRASGRRITGTEDHGDLLEIIAEDVTRRRHLEEELQQAQKMEALGQLAGSVAHDFNNLLGVIIGYSELLSADPAVNEPTLARLEIIKRAGARAASLTAQLLAFSRRQVLQPTVIHLNSLVRETQRMLERLMRENVEYKVTLDPALWKTKADAGQMVQIIMNLAVNARDAMPRGGMLAIETANVHFEDSRTFSGVEVAAGSYVRLSVSDTGTGMDEATQSRVFEPFFTTKDAGKGTGLGLATVYGIVKQSGGYIFVDSALGKGTRFDIYLPEHEKDHETSSKPADVARARESRNQSTSVTVMVVEDETAFRDLLRDGLEEKGYQVLSAANGVEALQVAEKHEGPIRLLVTDVIMPQMSGPELARTLRKARTDTDVLYMSGYTDDKVEDATSSSGDLTLMQKPFYIDDLVQKIEEILNRQRVEDSRRVS